MRISDWSSDVCSSDLLWNKTVDRFVAGDGTAGLVGVDLIDTVTGETSHEPTDGGFVAIGHSPSTELFQGRSEERRVGKECVRTCRTRWSPDPLKKKNTTSK